jgi:hypothetical protein
MQRGIWMHHSWKWGIGGVANSERRQRVKPLVLVTPTNRTKDGPEMQPQLEGLKDCPQLLGKAYVFKPLTAAALLQTHNPDHALASSFATKTLCLSSQTCSIRFLFFPYFGHPYSSRLRDDF